MTEAQKEYVITTDHIRSEFWCHNCQNRVRDNARKMWYCQKITTAITQAIWCTTWRCGCIWHSSAKKSDAVLDDNKKPSCFGAFEYQGCIRYSCIWVDRCKQSQEDY